MIEPVSTPRKQTVVLALAILLLGVVGCLMLRRFDPTESSYFPKCVLHQWTGLHCPGCGTTRAIAALAHGRIWESIRNNPLLILGGPIIFALIWLQRRHERAGGSASPRLSWTLLGVVLAYFVARNVPSPDRSWFAPPRVVSQEHDSDR